MAAKSSSNVWNISTTTGDQASLVEPPLQSLPLFKISSYIWSVGIPVILLLGNFGNIMTIVVMQKMRSEELVINLYFKALAIVDLVFLDITLLLHWIGVTFSFWVTTQNNVVCKIYSWISSFMGNVSAWFLVCLTIHRAVAVVWPHRVNLMCTRRRVFAIIIGVAAFFAIIYSHNLYGKSLVYNDLYNGHYCVSTPESYAKFVEDIFTYVDLVLYSLLPFTCLILANSVLVWKLKTSVRETRHKLAQTLSDQTEARQRTARSVTLTVILVSVAFIVLTLPASLFYIIHHVTFITHHRISVYQLAEFNVINAVTYLLMFSNSAVNFYLYCLTGKRFRDEFLKIMRCQRASSPPGGLATSGDSV